MDDRLLSLWSAARLELGHRFVDCATSTDVNLESSAAAARNLPRTTCVDRQRDPTLLENLSLNAHVGDELLHDPLRPTDVPPCRCRQPVHGAFIVVEVVEIGRSTLARHARNPLM